LGSSLRAGIGFRVSEQILQASPQQVHSAERNDQLEEQEETPDGQFW
jgi:hypothetical protein